MNSKYKRALFILTAIFLVMIGMYPMIFSKLNAQKRDDSVKKRMGMIPIPLASEEQDLQKRLEREYKNRRYKNPRGEDLTKQGEGEIYGRVLESAPPVPFPFSLSELVIVGKITRAQPYLSESKTTIYSEFSVSVEEVIQNTSGVMIAKGDSVLGDREGGAILMPDGRVLQYIVGGVGNLPEQEKRYVLFLKSNVGSKDYEIVTGYELHPDGIIPLEGVADRDVYAGKSESSFIAEVKSKVSSN